MPSNTYLLQLTEFMYSALECLPYIAGLGIFVKLVEPGLLSLTAFCSCDRTIFIQVQTQEH